jgi:hypothetical protein
MDYLGPAINVLAFALLTSRDSGCKSSLAEVEQTGQQRVCHFPRDWWVRSVQGREAGCENSAPKSLNVAGAEAFRRRKAASGSGRYSEEERVAAVSILKRLTVISVPFV